VGWRLLHACRCVLGRQHVQILASLEDLRNRISKLEGKIKDMEDIMLKKVECQHMQKNNQEKLRKLEEKMEQSNTSMKDVVMQSISQC
jgi:hypothetical protein